tara:strand:+ start:896 stop:1267 length:372 start_codon:yes stop_codon:yes gene_type:complete
MRKLSLITLIFLYSCSKEIDLRGDWMPIEFMNNGTITNELKNFPNTYIRNDNIIIYFDDVMYYKIKGDSMLFMPEDDISKVIAKKKIEIIDNNTFIFHYDRKIFNDTTKTITKIPYYSKWKRI